jgi:hypothetical protein
MRRLLFEWIQPLSGPEIRITRDQLSLSALYPNRISSIHARLIAPRRGAVRIPVHRARDHVPSLIPMFPIFKSAFMRKTDMEVKDGFIGYGNHQSAQGI